MKEIRQAGPSIVHSCDARFFARRLRRAVLDR
jgi:hypothetical protein